MSAPRIRPMTSDDAPEVARMVGELNETEGYHRGTVPDAEALRSAFLGVAAAGRLLVAEGAEGLAGYLTLHVTYETEFAARGCYLGDLYVRPQARRQGIGRSLVAAAARMARLEGGSYLWWTALPHNAASHAFYRAIGAEDEPIRAFVLTFGAFERLAREDAT